MAGLKKQSRGSDKIVFNRRFFAEARRRAWAKLSAEERKKAGEKQSPWKGWTTEQRSAEMKRRAKKRKRGK